MRMTFVIAIALSTLALHGCGGAADEPAGSSFAAAAPQNPLDGAVIRTAGNEAEWMVEDGALKTVVVSGRENGTIEFGEPANSVVVPREVSTDGGDSVFSIDRQADEVTIQTTAPFGLGPVEFTGPLPSELAVTRDLFLPNARVSQGVATLDEVSCDEIVSSVDAFCENYLSQGNAAQQEIADFAINLAERELGNSLANGFVSQTISEYFDVLDVFCDGFEQVTTVDAIDMCQSVR